MQFRLLAILLALLGSITACADEQQKDAMDNALTGERFFDAAASKLITGSPEMSRTVANCIVAAMTADGKIGLGEINQSTLDEQGVPKRSALREAYLLSQKACS